MNESLLDHPKLEEKITEFKDTLLQSIEEVNSISDNEKHLEMMSLKSVHLVGEINEIGELTNERFINSEKPSATEYHITYEWIGRAKEYMVLWRDVIFQQYKASVFLYEDEISTASYQKLREESESVLKETIGGIGLFDADGNEVLAKKIKKWQYQNNPWEVYKKQLATISSQCLELSKESENTILVSQILKEIKDEINTLFSEFDNIWKNLDNELNEIIATAKDAKEVISKIESIAYGEARFKTGQIFNDNIGEIIDKLSIKTLFPIELSDGLLLQKEIYIRRNTSNWLESEILPRIYEMYDTHQRIGNKFSLAKSNIKNKYNFEKQEGQTVDKDVILQLLRNYQDVLSKEEEEASIKIKDVVATTNKELKASNMYNPIFLPVSISSTLSNYKRYQLQGWESFIKWLEDKKSRLRKVQKNARKEELLSLSEKVVRVVRYRTPAPELRQYTNMFLTKGYIGDSFSVGREDEMNRVAVLIENWKKGFRGTLLISGTRYSGKTFFGFAIRNTFFHHNTIELSPNKTIRFAGRTMEVGYDLKEVLAFILKYGQQKPLMIWVDDLELWENDKISLAENAKQLLQVMDTYSSKLFFMVSMGNGLKTQMNKFYEMDKVFQCMLNMDEMPLVDTDQAIITRHYATHYLMTDSEGEELGLSQLKKVIKDIHYSSKGNIGVMLMKWACLVKESGHEQVCIKTDFEYQLPHFISTETAMLLRTIILHKKINEYMLVKKFGPSFKRVFKPILNRLFGLGLLLRHMDGTMEVNPFLANDIAHAVYEKLNLSYKQGTALKKRI